MNRSQWTVRSLALVLVIPVLLSSNLFFATAISAQEADEQPPIGLWEACPTPQNLPETITIGAPLGLTGPISVYGVPQQQGADIAVEEINASGYLGESQIVMAYEDTEGNAEQTIAAMTRLIEDIGVQAIFGPSLSTEAFAADPIAQEAGIPVMGVTTSAIGIPEMGDFVFRGNLPEHVLIPFMLDEVIPALEIEDVAILYGDDDDFTISGYDVFIEALEDRDVTILGEATFARGDIDFSPQLTTLLAEEPDALLVSALASEGVQIILQARQLGYEGPILGGNGFSTPDVIEQTGEAGNGLIVGASWNVGQQDPTESSLRFVEKFEEAYEYAPDQFSVQAYTAMWLFATAIRCTDSVAGEDIRDGLLAIEDMETPLGEFSFDPIGEPIHQPVVQVVEDGLFALFNPEE
ncbi:ABC transporter substrate-binding protein [Phototrophicus methaneseepsis]|uniref:ABC transporter substrate-binding protein n=1 Tax=Phototrophicus methaneseepsis TaxID=2710758 RepID=A0A7S8E5P5_9CHLR|nr:ABC transporter substrate-binding protein [Phototrophicus methaneseepsis]QPC80815.1 ABC transporter substrate-binding protein [Phototrophicus methaneseepsis]